MLFIFSAACISKPYAAVLLLSMLLLYFHLHLLALLYACLSYAVSICCWLAYYVV